MLYYNMDELYKIKKSTRKFKKYMVLVKGKSGRQKEEKDI
jgi:hypothetical protein